MLFDKKIKNVLATTTIATVFAFTLGTSQAFANSDTTTEVTVVEETSETTVGTDGQVVTETTNDTAVTESTESDSEVVQVVEAEVEVSTNIETEDLALLPGDFFYFFKTFTEKLKLTLTFGDIEKAQVLSNLAEERIKEAEALFAQGEEGLAKDTLELAIAQIEAAYDLGEETDTVEVEEDTDTTTEEDVAVVDPDDKTVVETTELEVKLSQNIIALTAAMEKIQNPQAKAALAKNIEKAYEKLAKKAAKLEEKEEKYVTESAEIEEKLANGEITEVEAEEKNAELQAELTIEQDKTVVESTKEVVKTLAKAEKAVEKEEKKNEKSVEKAEKKPVKEDKPAEKVKGKSEEAAKKADEKVEVADKKADEKAPRKADKEAKGKKSDEK